MRAVLAAAVAGSIGLIAVGYYGSHPPKPVATPAVMAMPAHPVEAAPNLTIMERQAGLEPHLFPDGCFMAAVYKRTQIPASALDDAYAAAFKPDAQAAESVYVATSERCPDAAHTAQNTPSLQAVE
jgi:hypothetical protein